MEKWEWLFFQIGELKGPDLAVFLVLLDTETMVKASNTISEAERGGICSQSGSDMHFLQCTPSRLQWVRD